MSILQPNEVATRIAKKWKPNQYLSNMSMAYFHEGEYAARRLFPLCPVQLSSGFYYTFSKADLARDNVQRKPLYGKVAPAIMGESDQSYHCKVDQVIAGIDQIATLNFTRSGAPGSADPRRARVRFIAEQMNIHQDRLFAEHFFKAGVWADEWTGDSTEDKANKKFIKFTDGNSNPIELFDELITRIKRNGRRTPNKLALGVDTFIGLKHNPFVMERIKYTGTSANPAVVNEQVLAQLFGLQEVVVLDTTYNAAGLEEDADMQFICDSKGALLCYATDNPQIDEPSAGYIFTWDMLGNGQYMSTTQYSADDATHTDYIEGLMSYDMHKCADDLAVYLTDCVD